MEQPQWRSPLRQELLYQCSIVEGRIQDSMAIYMVGRCLTSEWRYRLDTLLIDHCREHRLATVRVQGGITADFCPLLHGEQAHTYVIPGIKQKISEMLKCLAGGSRKCETNHCEHRYVFSLQAWRDMSRPFSFSKEVLIPS